MGLGIAHEFRHFNRQTRGIERTAVDGDFDALRGDGIDREPQTLPGSLLISGVLALGVGFGIVGHVHLLTS